MELALQQVLPEQGAGTSPGAGPGAAGAEAAAAAGPSAPAGTTAGAGGPAAGAAAGVPVGSIGGSAPALQPGRVLLMEVLSLVAGEARVRLAGQSFTARGQLPPEPGSFWVRVEAAAPGLIKLKLLTEPGAGARPPADLAAELGLPAGKESAALVRALVRWRLQLSPEPARALLAEARDLPPEAKPFFFAARAWLETLNLAGKPKELAEALPYLLRRPDAAPEGQAALNQALPLLPGREVVRFLSFQAGRGEGEVYLVREGRASPGDGAGPKRLVVRVATERWGEVWVELTLTGKNIAARVSAADPALPALAQAAQVGLAARLEGLGFTLAALRVGQRAVHSILDFLAPAESLTYSGIDVSV